MPAYLNKSLFKAVAAPKIFSGLRMVIGVFGFYNPWIPFYEVQILLFCQILRHRYSSGTPHQVTGDILGKIWEPKHYDLL